MAKQMLSVNCLVQVTTSNHQDFTEWLEYHIALGFDRIYVFDTDVRGWLDGICDKYRDHVTLVPRDDWRKKHTIVETYTRRRRAPEWAVCLSDNEFLWLSPALKCNIKGFINKLGGAGAITVYTKYLSSEKPMKYRVGTQIDCFTHCRPNPQGVVAPNENTPNTGVTFFHIMNPEFMPLKTNIIPNTNNWVDALGGRLSPEIINRTISARDFDPVRYPLRCYKFALRSGNEMNFRPGTKPTGYTVSDPTMQEARQLLLRIPVNLETEKLFAKTEMIADEEKPVVEAIELSPEVKAELELPIRPEKIDEMILRGSFYEDIVDYLVRNELAFDADALTRVFNRERETIINENPAYRKMQELVNNNATDDEIMRALNVTKSTYAIMRSCLMVLDIRLEAEAENEPATDETQKVEPVANQNIDTLVADFEKDNAENDLTPEEKAANDEKFAEESAKHQEKLAARRKKYQEKNQSKEKKPSKAKKPVVKPNVTVEPTAETLETTNALADVDIPDTMPELDSLLDDVDIESLTNK